MLLALTPLLLNTPPSPRLSAPFEADQMSAKLQNAEPLMAPDLRVKAMKEAYAGKGAVRVLQRSLRWTWRF